jgi:hypothetical protein
MRAAAVLLVLALAPAGAADAGDEAPPDYALRLVFERGGETRRFESAVRLGEHYNTVLASSGTVAEHMIVNVMPVAVDGADRIELLYQVEWAVGGALLQAQDSAELSPREDAVLSAQAGAWTLRGGIAPAFGVDSCAPPPAGGGLLVTARVRLGGRERTLTRRTVPFVMSNLLVREPGEETLVLGLEVQCTSEGHPLKVRAVAEWGKAAVGGVTTSADVPFGRETLVAGDAAGDAVWVTLAELPPTRPAKVEVPEVLGPDGWLRHAGPVVSFSHPPRWAVRPDCDAGLNPKGWGLVDTSLPEERRAANVLTLYRAPPGEGSAARRAAARIAALPPAERKAVETVTTADGECLLWRADGEARTASAVCELGGGFPLEGLLLVPDGGKDPFPDFRRVVLSLRSEAGVGR